MDDNSEKLVEHSVKIDHLESDMSQVVSGLKELIPAFSSATQAQKDQTALYSKFMDRDIEDKKEIREKREKMQKQVDKIEIKQIWVIRFLAWGVVTLTAGAIGIWKFLGAVFTALL